MCVHVISINFNVVIQMHGEYKFRNMHLFVMVEGDMEEINKKRHRSEYILLYMYVFIYTCLFAPLSGCVSEAVPAQLSTPLKGT